MSEKPILMSAPMVRALLAGTKTQTRRVVKPQPSEDAVRLYVGMITAHDIECAETGMSRGFGFEDEDQIWQCPYGKPGDRLWVRETTRMRYLENLLTGEATKAQCGEYVADGEPVLDELGFDLSWWYSRKTCPGIHMPRWASRITLEVTAVRVERLHDISEADAIAEGCSAVSHLTPDSPMAPAEWNGHTARADYAELWESINGPGAWDANPFVWVLEFSRVQP